MEPRALILCPLTLRPGLFACTPQEYGEILDAGVRAGYRGVSVAMIDVEIAAAAGGSIDGFLGQFGERGLSLPIVEAISGWGQGQSEVEIAEQATPVLEFAARAGAEVVVAISTEPTIPSLAVAARGFRFLCALAQSHGLKVAIEFFPWGGIGDIRTARDVVMEAGAPGGGICLDIWHWARAPGGLDWEGLRGFPADQIHVVQIDDAAAEAQADPMRETLRGRLLPGEGVACVVDVLRVLREIGADPLFAPEVFSRRLFEEGPGAMALQVARSSRAVLSQAGYDLEGR